MTRNNKSKKHENPSLRAFINRTNRYQERKINLEPGTTIELQVIEDIKLKKSLKFHVLKESGTWILHNNELNIRAWGKDYFELMGQLANELHYLRDGIWTMEDWMLNENARRLKNLLGKYFY